MEWKQKLNTNTHTLGSSLLAPFGLFSLFVAVEIHQQKQQRTPAQYKFTFSVWYILVLHLLCMRAFFSLSLSLGPIRLLL